MDTVVKELLESLYGVDRAPVQRIIELVEHYRPGIRSHRELFYEDSGMATGFPLNESDVVLLAGGELTPDALYRFLDEECDGTVSSVCGTGPADDFPQIAREYRLMVNLDPGVPQVADTPDTAAAVVDPAVMTEAVEGLLRNLASGAQIVRLPDTAPRGFFPLAQRILELVDPEALLVVDATTAGQESSAGEDAQPAHLTYQSDAPEVLMDAVGHGSTGALQEWAAGGRFADTAHIAFNGNMSAGRAAGADLVAGAVLVAGADLVAGTSGDDGYLDALVDPNLPDSQRARVYLAAQAAMLALAGVPGIGMSRFIGGVVSTEYQELADAVNNPETVTGIIFDGYKQLLSARTQSRAFHPTSAQRVLPSGADLFVLVRGPVSGESVLCIHNLSAEDADFEGSFSQVGRPEEGVFLDLISGDRVFPGQEAGGFSLTLSPWECLWLQLGGS